MSTSKMVEILGRLRKNMNGEVAERMSAYGVNYALNYGVAIHTLKELAKEYAPDTKLALLLYQQQVRDLQIMACYIASPEDISFEDEQFWGSPVSNCEMAEQLSGLLSRSNDSCRFVKAWLNSPNKSLQYCALLIAAKNASNDSLQAVAEFLLRNTEFDLGQQRILATLLSKHHTNPDISNAIQYVQSSSDECLQQINNDIYINE